jgi:hypothetical protein
MIRNLLSRAMPLTTAGVVVLVVVGAAMGGNLPFGIQQAVSDHASEVGIEMPSPSTTDPYEFRTNQPRSESASDRPEEVHTAIDRYNVEVEAWRTCISDTASQRGTDKANTSAPPQTTFGNPATECGAKPRLDVPRPADDSLPTQKPDQDRGPSTTTSGPDQAGHNNLPDRPTPPASTGTPNRP